MMDEPPQVELAERMVANRDRLLPMKAALDALYEERVGLWQQAAAQGMTPSVIGECSGVSRQLVSLTVSRGPAGHTRTRIKRP